MMTRCAFVSLAASLCVIGAMPQSNTPKSPTHAIRIDLILPTPLYLRARQGHGIPDLKENLSKHCSCGTCGNQIASQSNPFPIGRQRCGEIGHVPERKSTHATIHPLGNL